MPVVVIGALVLLALPPTALGDHTANVNGWFDIQYNEDDDSILYCTSTSHVALEADLFLHDRPGFAGSTSMASGGGSWLYQETNGNPGIQIGGTIPLFGGFDLDDAVPGLFRVYGEDPFSRYCPNSDTLIFGYCPSVLTRDRPEGVFPGWVGLGCGWADSAMEPFLR